MQQSNVPNANAPSASESTRIVKRYANRKLYDTRDSRYVTLVQIAEYVKAGEDVRIIDNNTKEDLTTITLAQIIYEQEKKGEAEARSMSIGTLRDFIQVGGQRLIDTLREGPVGKLIHKREDEKDSLSEEKKRSMLDKSREALEELQRVADDRLRSLISSALAPIHHLQGEVKRLQARIDELEALLVKASQPRAPGAKEPSDPKSSKG